MVEEASLFHEQAAWHHTSSLLAMIKNASANHNGKASSPDDFYPKSLKRSSIEQTAAEPMEIPFDSLKGLMGATAKSERVKARPMKVVKR